MLPSETSNGSEGTAYRYTKKVLMALPNRCSLQSIYEKVAQERGISSWTRAAYQDVRAHFFRDGQCKIRFAPGAARLAFGELSLGTGDEEPGPIGRLHDIIRIISIAHSGEYDRYLGMDGRRPSFKELDEIYGQRIAKHWSAMKRMLRRRKYGQRRYKIIPLDEFETAKEYAEYTKPHVWCHLNSKSMFDHYRMASAGDKKLPVKLYLAVLPGFEDLTENDELYGESMLGIDIGPGGRLVHVNNRWNHAHDNLDVRKGDNKYDEVELSDLLGGPFFELCPPYGHDTYRELAVRMREERLAINAKVIADRKAITKSICLGKNRIRRSGTFTDPRDGNAYRTETIGGRTWMADPLRYSPTKIPEIPENPENLKATLCPVRPEIKVFFPILCVTRTEEGLTCSIDWQHPADVETANGITHECNGRVNDSVYVHRYMSNNYVVKTSSRCYVSMGGNIDVYDAIYNVFLEGVKIGDTIIDGSLLDDESSYHVDFGQGDNYWAQVREEREQTVRDALMKANLPHDEPSVTVVTDMLVKEYGNGRGIGEFRLSDQVGNSATYRRASLALLTYSNVMPYSRNYSRFGKTMNLITYRYKADVLTPETEAIIRALDPSITVSMTVEDGSHGVLYSHEDIKKAVPEGWRLPTLDDLYRLYSALGGKVIRSGAEDCHKMCSNSWSNGRAFTMCGVRIPRQLNKDDAYPSLYITTDQGRCDIVRSNEHEDDEIRETGKSAPDIMRNLLGFGPLANPGAIRNSGVDNVAPFVSQEVGITDLVDNDENVRRQIHWFRSARVDLVGDRLIMHTEVERQEERRMVGDEQYITDEDYIQHNTFTNSRRRFLFLVKD